LDLVPLIYTLVKPKKIFYEKERIVVQKVSYPMIQYDNKLVSYLYFVGDAIKNIKINLPNGSHIKEITLSYDKGEHKAHHKITIPESQYYIDDIGNLNICATDETTFLILTTQIKNPKLEIYLDSVLGDDNAINVEYDRSVFSVALRGQTNTVADSYTANMVHDVIDSINNVHKYITPTNNNYTNSENNTIEGSYGK